jgi:DNA (cytosine-5)-methyltransferase 1
VDLAWHAEIDPNASLVLKTHEPDVPNLGDFTTPDFWEHAAQAYVHLGGIPCQPFSAAGRQRGTEDHRHLWPFWLKGIKVQRPSLVVFENVANLTQGKMRPVFNGICADLAELGYAVRWCLLGACAVGAAHHRHRVFLVAQLGYTPGVEQVTVPGCPSGRLLPTPTARDGSTRGEGDARFWAAKRATGRTNGIPLGAVVQLEWDAYAVAIERHAAVLGRPTPEPTETGPRGGRRLAAAFSEWLMMLPEGHLTSVLERNPALARAGNGVVPLQAATAIRLLLRSY